MQASAFPVLTKTATDRLASVPVPIFGAALGLIGFSLLAKINPRLLLLPLVAQGSLALGVTALCLGIVIHLIRLLIHHAAFRLDLKNAAICPFFGQIGIALLLLAEAWHDSSSGLASQAFYAGTGLSAITGLWWIYRMGVVRFALASVSPGWLVPPIACLYIAILAPDFLLPQLGLAALLLGVAGSIFSFCMLGLRLIHGPGLPKPALPALAIFFAIPALISLWLTNQAGQFPWLSGLFFYLNSVAYLIGLIVFILLLRKPFVISCWAFGMPLTATSMALTMAAGVDHFRLGASLADLTAFSSLLMTLILSLAGLVAAWRHMLRD